MRKLKDADVEDLAIHRRFGRTNYSRRYVKAPAMHAVTSESRFILDSLYMKISGRFMTKPLASKIEIESLSSPIIHIVVSLIRKLA